MAKRTLQDFLGPEPEPKNENPFATHEMIEALNWYNYCVDNATLKEYAVEHCEKNYPDWNVSKIPESELLTSGKIFRMVDRGINVGEDLYIRTVEKVEKLAERYEQIAEEKASERPNRAESIQSNVDMMMTNLRRYASDNPNWSKVITGMEIKPLHARRLLEGMNDMPDTLKAVLEPLAAVKATRKRKAKIPEKMVEKVQYMESFPELNVNSISPEKIPGSNEVWLYNTKYKILTVLKSKSGMTVKGTTIYDFDEKLSEAKRMRKPENFLRGIVPTTNARLGQILKEQKTKPCKVTGRVGKETLIMGVY